MPNLYPLVPSQYGSKFSKCGKMYSTSKSAQKNVGAGGAI